MSNRDSTPPINEGTLPPGQGLHCQRCGAGTAGQAWFVALWSPDALWAGWALCDLCFRMVEDAIALEMAGAGPGGHREVRPPELEPP